jgi:CBS domain-containing protein
MRRSGLKNGEESGNRRSAPLRAADAPDSLLAGTRHAAFCIPSRAGHAGRVRRRIHRDQECAMKVREAMTGDVRLTDPNRSIREAAEMMAEQDIGALPIGENDRLVGMITDRDIAVRAVARGLGPDTKIRDVMSPEVMYCFEDEDLDDATKNMGDIKVRRLPVLNRDKRLVGIISISDLTRREDAKRIGRAIADISSPGGAHSQAAH